MSGEVVNVIIFQRLITVGEWCDDLLCSHPIGLFESYNLLLQANKAALADVLWTEKGLVPLSEVPGDLHYLLDSGTLLHRIPWPRSYTYDPICQLYVNYVTQKYNDAAIIFDGYTNIKDGTHMKRIGNCVDTFPVIWLCNAENMTF